jgi:hypothetical protein
MSNRWSIVLYWVEGKALIDVRPEMVFGLPVASLTSVSRYPLHPKQK